ncbi:MAG: DNA topoisomerase 3 [Chitinophagaceae bacterium]|nr:DNA topoisomerase 3 [Chitinophagaceae bacterium]
MKIVIAEKPSVARDLARVLGANKKKEGYLEGEGYCFTWAFGHLIQLAQPESYGYADWSADNLPMLPEKFKLVTNQKYNQAKKKYEADAGVLKQLNVIKKLFIDCDEIIVATDAGREGELIFRYIYEFLECKKPFKRLWISSQTDKAILEGFSKLQDGKKYDTLYYSAKGRSEADWLVGMNATRALTISSGIKGVFSLGRVQTPTLAMICERYVSNKNFVPEIYFKVVLSFSKNNIDFTALSEKSYKSKDDALKAENEAKTVLYANISNIEVKDKKETPPLLYDLTSLQQDANKKFSLSADQTLKIAQNLYESKLITYPRTGSRFISDDVFENIATLITQFENHTYFGQAAKYLKGKKLNKKSVNDAKVTDHHALLPTENIAPELKGDELNIYHLIVSRLIEAFHEDCLKKVTKVTIDAKTIYIANGTVILHPGWRMVKNQEEEEEEKTEDNINIKLPELIKDEQLKIISSSVDQKQTKPKPIHNEASLLKAMETCGREVEDEELKEAMKETGLGTPATRAAIIETLFTRAYRKAEKNLVPTDRGMAVYNLVREKSISKPLLTGQWEKKLEDMRKGELEPSVFKTYIIDYTKEITSELLTVDKEFKATADKLNTADNSGAGICPACKKGNVREGKKNYYCTAYKEGCTFKIWKEIAGRKITELQIKTLIEKGKTSIIKGFKNKNGKDFAASLKLIENEVKFDFPEQNK